MSRRNVLGKQMEESKTMWVVLTGILVSVFQFIIYYFIGEGFFGIMLAGISVLAGGMLVHFIMEEQEELFSYLLIPCIFSGIAGFVIPQLSGDFLPESKTVFIFGVISLILVVVYAVVYTLRNGISEMESFIRFHKKATVFFYLIYFGVFFYELFFQTTGTATKGELQLLPLDTFATYMEGLIRGQDVLDAFLLFLQKQFLFFVPFGFLVGMLGRKWSGLLRFILILLFPVLLELVRFLVSNGSCDVDNVIFGFLGALLGMFAFLGFNELFHYFIGRNFDGSEINRDYYGRKI